MAFSSLYEEKCCFTRDYGLIKTELQNLDDYDKTCIETALHGVNQMVLSEWGNNTACQVGIHRIIFINKFLLDNSSN